MVAGDLAGLADATWPYVRAGGSGNSADPRAEWGRWFVERIFGAAEVSPALDGLTKDSVAAALQRDADLAEAVRAMLVQADVVLRLDYMVGQITREEFRWQDANYERDSALGRELLFLIAENAWVRATSETINIARSDAIETAIEIDVDFDRITHEAFRDRTGSLWLPVLVLPPIQQWLPEPDPFSTLKVTDASSTPLTTLPSADVRHRIAAALTEIIVNLAAGWLVTLDGGEFTATRDHRLMLSAAIYRLLRSEHVPPAVLELEEPARRTPDAPLSRIGRVRTEIGELLKRYANLLTAGQDDPDGTWRQRAVQHLTERGIGVLRAFTESRFVVVAVHREQVPTVLTVTVPSRPLHRALPGSVERAGETAAAWRLTQPTSWRWPRSSSWILPGLQPSNWILPRASLLIDLLLPSGDADRQIQVNLPDGISPDPSRPLANRAALDIGVGQPLLADDLTLLTEPLRDGKDRPPALRQCFADLAGAKAEAALESLREHRVGAATASLSSEATREFRQRMEKLAAVLREISAGDDSATTRSRLAEVWADAAWLRTPMQRRTATEMISPDVVVARARMIEDASQRAVPTAARLQVHIAVTDSEYLSASRVSGRMSTWPMMVVLAFFLFLLVGRTIRSDQVSAEVLAFVLTLFSAVQASRIEQADRSTIRGLLAQAGNPLIIASILPTVILAVALAFSRSAIWASSFAAVCILMQALQALGLRHWEEQTLARGRRPADGVHGHRGVVLHTDSPDFTHAAALNSDWWRSTTASALMISRPAYGYVIWQHGVSQTLYSLLQGGRPVGARRWAGHGWTHRSPSRFPRQQGEADVIGVGISPLEQPANVLALQRSGAGAQSLNFAVFRDQPQANWTSAPDGVVRVDLDPGRLTPMEMPSEVVWVFVGFPRNLRTAQVASHPLTAVLKAASGRRLVVVDVQLPVPVPVAGHADLHWARVQLGLRDGDIARLPRFLEDVHRLTQEPDGPVIGVQTIAEGIPRILDPEPATVGADSAARLVFASDLDVVAATALYPGEGSGDRTWRIMAISANWRGGVDYEMLAGLDHDLNLIGMTFTILHGKAVLLLLGHRTSGHRPSEYPDIDVHLDKWQSRTELGTAPRYPLLQVHMRTPDRPGATLAVLESLREILRDRAPGSLRQGDWNVWYATSVVQEGDAALMQFTVWLATDPDQDFAPEKPLAQWGSAEFSKIARLARDLAIRKMVFSQASGSPLSNGLDTPVDTVMSVNLMRMPYLT